MKIKFRYNFGYQTISESSGGRRRCILAESPLLFPAVRWIANVVIKTSVMKTSLDSLSIQILTILLQSETPVSSLAIAKKLNTSPRVVRSRIHALEDLSEASDLQVISKRGYGFLIDFPDAQKRMAFFQDIQSTKIENVYYAPNDRLHFILLRLLIKSKPIIIKRFGHILQVSRTTVIKDLQKAEAWLQSFNISIEKRQNYGCELNAAEIDSRRAIYHLLLESVGEIELLTVFANLNSRSTRQQLAGIGSIFAVKEYLAALKLHFFHRLVSEFADLARLDLSDRDHLELGLQLAIMSDRLRNDRAIEIPPLDFETIRSDNNYSLAKVIGEQIQKQVQLRIPESEFYYLTLLINRTGFRNQVPETSSSKPIKSRRNQDDIDGCVEILLKNAARYLYPTLWLDRELKDSLHSHLAWVAQSGADQRSEVNPLLQDVKQIYPEIFRVAHLSIVEAQRQFGWQITEDEVGYITMHLAAAMERLRLHSGSYKRAVIICNAGIATSKLLASRVATEFPELEIVGVMSYLEYMKIKDSIQADLVISTIPSPHWNKPAIVVGPFLDSRDVAHIRTMIGLAHGRVVASSAALNSRNGQPSLIRLITPDTIALKVSATDWPEVVDRAGNLLLHVSAIEPRYIEAMKHIQAEHGPYMVIMPGIALLHAYPEDGVKYLCMSLVTLDRPIRFGHADHDPVDIAIALGAVNNYSHLRAISELMEVLQNQAAVDVIRTTYMKSRVMQEIASICRKA